MGFGSFEKILQVLDILEDATTGLSFDEIYAKLDAPRSTLYRYLKALTNAGLIASLPNTGYTLGPRIAELDYKMRTQDLLVVVSRPLMADLVHTTPAVALLCRLYRNSVLCVHQESHPDAMRSNYERGRSRPLLQGAASRVILAYMAPRMIAKLFDEQPEQFKTAQLGESIPDVKTVLRKIRQRGWESVEGQVTPGATGIAAPIFDAGGHIVGSLSLTLNKVGMDPADVFRIAERVSTCAEQITDAIGLHIEEHEALAPVCPPSTELPA